ncbi:MAG: hypothetical protein AAGJ46_20675 [Planctomycetota bacterium]
MSRWPRFSIAAMLAGMGFAVFSLILLQRANFDTIAGSVAGALIVAPAAFAAGFAAGRQPPTHRHHSGLFALLVMHLACWSTYWFVSSFHLEERDRLPELPSLVEHLHTTPGTTIVHSVAAGGVFASFACGATGRLRHGVAIGMAAVFGWLVLFGILYIGCGVALVPLIGPLT